MDETKTSVGDPTRTSLDAEGSSLQAPLSLPERIGKYKILSCLGRGGMGVVYEAEQQQPRRKVALKVILGGQHVDESHIKMFEREADALARLKHPHIASIFESGRTDEGQHFFAMELVRGETLDTAMARRGPVIGAAEIRFRLNLFRSICDAVHYAHQRGVIHRDLKPANIIVVDRDAEASGVSDSQAPIKILDFGLARMIDPDLADPTVQTELGTIKGTLPYMSPEQASGKSDAIDTRTDVYALGVVLYEMLTGSRPYDLSQAALLEAIRVICEEAPRPTSSVVQPGVSIDRDLETILGKALEKAPDRRYSSVAMFSEDINRFLHVEPILARPPSAAYQLRKFAARNRGLVAAASLLITALVLGLIGTSIGFSRAKTEARRAENVAGFFRQMLTGVRPFVAQGRDTELMLSIVNDAAENVDTELAEDPAVAATLHKTLGETYSSLGETELADQQLTSALDLFRSLNGENSLEVLEVRRGLAVNAANRGRVAAAEAEYRAILDKLGNDSAASKRTRLKTLRSLAVLMLDERRYDEAAEILEEILPDLKQEFGMGGTDTLIAMQTLGLSYLGLGAHEKGEEQLIESREAYREQYGTRHPLYITATFNLGGVYTSQRMTERAAEFYEEALVEAEEVFGPDHPETAAMMAMAGDTFRLNNQLEAAEKHLNRALEIQREVRGADHPDTIHTQVKIADLLRTQRKYPEADALLQDILERSRRVFGNDDARTIEAMVDLVEFYQPFRMFEQAEPLAAEAVEIARVSLDPDNLASSLALQTQANLFADMERFDDAVRLYEEVLENRRSQLGDQHPATLVALNSLGVTRMRQERWDDARALIEEAVAGQRLRLGEHHRDTVISFYNLAWITANSGRYEEAVEHFRIAAEGFEVLYGATHRNVVLARRSLANQLMKLERFEEAKKIASEQLAVAETVGLADEAAHLTHAVGLADYGLGEYETARRSVERAILLFEETFGVGHWQATQAKVSLGRVLSALGHAADAEKLLLAGYAAFGAEPIQSPSRMGRALRYLVEFYEKHGNANEVALWQQRLADHEAAQPS